MINSALTVREGIYEESGHNSGKQNKNLSKSLPEPPGYVILSSFVFGVGKDFICTIILNQRGWLAGFLH